MNEEFVSINTNDLLVLRALEFSFIFVFSLSNFQACVYITALINNIEKIYSNSWKVWPIVSLNDFVHSFRN